MLVLVQGRPDALAQTLHPGGGQVCLDLPTHTRHSASHPSPQLPLCFRYKIRPPSTSSASGLLFLRPSQRRHVFLSCLSLSCSFLSSRLGTNHVPYDASMFALQLVSSSPRSPLPGAASLPPSSPPYRALANHRSRALQLLAAGSITLINGAPVSAPLADVETRAASSHSLDSRSPKPDPSLYVQVFSGNGALTQGWPAVKQWIPSYDEM